MISRGLAALAPILVVPLALHYVGAEFYGAWATALSLTGLVLFADLGVGTGLMTKVGATASTDPQQARRYVTSGYLMLTGLVTMGLLVMWISAIWVDWGRVLGVATPGQSEAEYVALIVFSAFLLNMLTSLVVRVQYGMQEMALSNLWQASGSALGLATVVIAVQFDVGSISLLVCAAFAPSVVSLLNTCVFFRWGSGKGIRPAWVLLDFDSMRELLSLGSRFLAVAVLMAIAISTDTWVVAQTTSLSEVIQFSVPARIFAFIGTIIAMLSLPFWPVNAEAIAAGDSGWVERTTRRMTLVTPLAVGSVALVAVWLGPTLLDRWLSGAIAPQTPLLLGLAVLLIVQAVVAPRFMVQNGAQVVRPQIVGYAIFLVALPLKWLVSSRFGYQWIPWTGALLYCLIIWPTAVFGYRSSLRAITGS